METSFIVDSNAGKLARWLRMMGYDTLFFSDIEDSSLVELAIEEGRTVVTRDTQIPKRRAATNGHLRVILVRDDNPRQQLLQVIGSLNLDWRHSQFTRCLECNSPLLRRRMEEVKDLVPPYVYRTQTQYMQCPSCHRVYWRGTHWERMAKALAEITTQSGENNESMGEPEDG